MRSIIFKQTAKKISSGIQIKKGAVWRFWTWIKVSKSFLKVLALYASEVFLTRYSSSKDSLRRQFEVCNALSRRRVSYCVEWSFCRTRADFWAVIQSRLIKHEAFQFALLPLPIGGAGHKQPVFRRRSNFFIWKRNSMKRIERYGARFPVLNHHYSFLKKKCRSWLNSSERLSQWVLRPLYQRRLILPILAYLGGPREVVYWLNEEVSKTFLNSFSDFITQNFALLFEITTACRGNENKWIGAFKDPFFTKKGIFYVFGKRLFVLSECWFWLSLMENKSGVNFRVLFDKKGAQASSIGEEPFQDSFCCWEGEDLKIIDKWVPSSKGRGAEAGK